MAEHLPVSDDAMDKLLAKLSEQQRHPNKQSSMPSMPGLETEQQTRFSSPSHSVTYTPATDTFSNESRSSGANESTVNADAQEMLRLKRELDATKDELARQKLELDQTRVITNTFEYAMSPTSESGFNRDFKTAANIGQIVDPPLHFMASSRHNRGIDNERHPLASDATVNGHCTPAPPNVWPGNRHVLQIGSPMPTNPQFQHYQHSASGWGQSGGRPWAQCQNGSAIPHHMLSTHQSQAEQQRNFPGPVSPGAIGDGRIVPELHRFQGGFNSRRTNAQNQQNGQVVRGPRNNAWQAYGPGLGGLDGLSMGTNPASPYQHLGMYPSTMSYQPRPIGTPLSPTAVEFQTTNRLANPWNAGVSISTRFSLEI